MSFPVATTKTGFLRSCIHVKKVLITRIDTPESKAALAAGAKHPDWKVRRQTINILRRYEFPSAVEVAKQLSQDADPAVRVEAAHELAQQALLEMPPLIRLRNRGRRIVQHLIDSNWAAGGDTHQTR